MAQNNYFKFILNLTYIIKFLVPTAINMKDINLKYYGEALCAFPKPGEGGVAWDSSKLDGPISEEVTRGVSPCRRKSARVVHRFLSWQCKW